MFNLGFSELILIAIIALIFIGPKQLPEIARTIGRALNELKRASNDLTSNILSPDSYKENQASSKLPVEPTKQSETVSQESTAELNQDEHTDEPPEKKS